MNNNNQSIHIKKEVLVKIIKAFFSENFAKNVELIPFEMRPKGMNVPYRCCIYKERAILRTRIIAGLGFSIENDDEIKQLSVYAEEALARETPASGPLTVIDAACKGCTPHRIHVTDLCQGCVARPCQSVCKFGAISMSNGRSVIDGAKCKNCKMCIAQCPYNAIVKIIVPCEDACPVDAIVKDTNGFVQIDYDACLSCGKCIMNCPFGAVHEKSQIIDILKQMQSGGRVIALIAPSIVGQFPGGVYRLKTAMQKAGFADVYEVAQGADTTTRNEAREFAERMEAGAPFMTTSCCAGYSQFINKHLPEIREFVSATKTPLYYIAEKVRRDEPSALTVFISPCVAKKNEGRANPNIDFVMNYEELGALLIARNIEILDCEEAVFDTESSKQGRNFGVSGGVAGAVASISQGDVRPCVINGLDKTTIKLLKKMAKDRKCEEGNLVEVMCCENGCIGGNATICPPKTAQRALAQFCAGSSDLKRL